MGFDYTDATGSSLTFPIGDSAMTTTVSLDEDTNVEDVEHFNFQIHVSGATAMVTSVSANANIAKVFIMDRSSIFWIDPMYIGEEGSTFAVTVHRAGYLGRNTDEVVVTVTDQTATLTPTADYTDPSTTITFAQGAVSEELMITLATDTNVEDMEYFQVMISVMGTTANTGTVDTAFMTANVFIIDLSSIFWIDPMYTGEEGSTFAVTVHRAGYLGRNTDEVVVTVTDQTATLTPTTDYTDPSTTITFAQGAASEELMITLATDTNVEDMEYFQVMISVMGTTANTGTVDTAFMTANVFIIDLSSIFWIDPMYTGEEGSTFAVTVHRAGYLGRNTDEVVVTVTDQTATLTPTTDYTDPSTTITFAQGAASEELMITLATDTNVEDMEYFQVMISVMGTTANTGTVDTAFMTANVFIIDLSSIFWIDPMYTGEEGSTFAVTVHRAGYLGRNTDEVVVTVTDQTATLTPTTDYTDPSTTITFAQGAASEELMITLATDTNVEDMEYFQVMISVMGTTANTGTVDTAFMTANVFIIDLSSIFWIDPMYTGEEGSTFAVTVHRAGYLGRNTDEVVVTVTDQTATLTPTTDYTDPSTTITFAQGAASEELMITLATDTNVEDMEYFQVMISVMGTTANTGTVDTAFMTANVFIIDLSSIFWIDPMYTGEEGSTFAVTVHRAGYLGRNTDEVVVTVTDQTATLTPTTDYTDPSTTITFAQGAASEELMITLATDTNVEDMEYFQVMISVMGTTANTGTVDTAFMTANVFIIDLSSIFWIDPMYTGEEGSTFAVTVHRAGYLGRNTDEVVVTVTDQTATLTPTTDYTDPSTTITFAQGAASEELMITLATDTNVEDMEYFQVMISVMGTTANTGTVDTAFMTANIFIIDLSSIFWIDPMYIDEEGATLTVAIHRGGHIGRNNDEVDIVITPVTATALDYTAPAASVTYAEGAVVEELSIALATDPILEGIEYFQITISVMGTTATTGSVDVAFMTADIFILDLSSIFWIEEAQYLAFEETTLTVTFHRGGYISRADTIMVTYSDARATDPEDYSPVGDGMITFTDDVTAVTKTIAIHPDNELEYNEMFTLSISVISGSATEMTGQIESPATSEVIIKDLIKSLSRMIKLYSNFGIVYLNSLSVCLRRLASSLESYNQ
ncbi:uncharacterized protein [Amphiura filiformis]|uniref:uncharacterized protein n=1 Tax=Amphiura filiformis TaxID=82378 RepID=UPI003B223FAB